MFPNRSYELLVKEYEIAANRYENIYKAIWQNFSYMVAISGVIITFGYRGENLPVLPVIFISVFPLMFWYFVTFKPMDYYGKCTALRLAGIEKSLNKLNSLSEEYNLPEEFNIQLYQNFIEKYELKKSPRRNKVILEEPFSVSKNVKIFGVVFLIMFSIIILYLFFNLYWEETYRLLNMILTHIHKSTLCIPNNV